MPIPFLPVPERAAPGFLPERMDRPGVDAGQLRQAFDALERLGRWSREPEILLRALERTVHERRPGRLRLLDVGAGGGGTTASLFLRLRALGWCPRPVLGDLHPVALRIARERWHRPEAGAGRGGREAARQGERDPRQPTDIERVPTTSSPTPPAATSSPTPPAGFVRLRASRLPFQDGVFDFAFSTTTLHHLEREEAAAFLSELERVSDGRWAVLDLRRSHATRLAVRLLALTLWRNNPLPRVDGPISARRAFTLDEIRRTLEGVDLRKAAVRPRFPFRLQVSGRRAKPPTADRHHADGGPVPQGRDERG